MNCVKIEMLAECINGKMESRNWTEYWSPNFVHPYYLEFADEECGGDKDMALLYPSVGKHGHILYEDISCISDRMTCGIVNDVCGGEWDRAKGELESAINSAFSSGEVKWVTILGDEDDTFATFRLTPLERIPDMVDWVTLPKGCTAEERKNIVPDFIGTIPKRVRTIFRNAVRAANGDEPLPLPPKPLRLFSVTYSRTDFGVITLEAEDEESAIALAKADARGTFLQSDPDRTADDWEFTAVRAD